MSNVNPFAGDIETAAPLPLDEELALIERARNGSKAATNQLMMQYAAGLRAFVARATAGHRTPEDVAEAQQNAATALMEAIHSARPGERLSQILGQEVQHAQDEYLLHEGLSVPARTRRKVVAAITRAGGDMAAAEEQGEMSPEVFRAASQAMYGLASLDNENLPEVSGIERGYATVEQRRDASIALSSVDKRTADVCRDAYGFTDYDPIPDAEIAHRRGLTRPTVQRIRARGLADMHDALCGEGLFRDSRCERHEAHEDAEVSA